MCTPLKIVEKAINSFNEDENELYLIEHGLNERCICARLALHITNVLPGTHYCDYVADVEYNRNAANIKDEKHFKTIEANSKTKGTGRIIVDLIVHKRGENPDYNLIYIEMKKPSSNKAGISTDEERLCYLTCQASDYKYKLGVMVIVDKANRELKIKCIAEDGSTRSYCNSMNE